MGRRPQDDPLIVRFHKIAESQDPAWDRWMEHGDLTGMVTILSGSPPWLGSEIKERTSEYEKILVRLNARYTEHRDYWVALRAEELAAQAGTDPADLATLGKKKYTQELIAKMLSEEFHFSVSGPRVSRSIIDLNDGIREWPVRGNTHSINGPTRRPRPRSD